MAYTKLDSSIPQLINTAALAAEVGLPRTEISMYYLSGLIEGHKVEGGDVVFRPEAVEKLKNDPRPSAAKRDPKIPELVSTRVLASEWGISRAAVDALYRRGVVPGVVVNRMLFRRDLAKKKPPRTEATKPRRDPKIPDLVDAAGAAKILGESKTMIRFRYLSGQLPGAEPFVGEDRVRAGSWVFRRELVESLVGVPFKSQPKRDRRIPDLVSTGVAGRMLGGGREVSLHQNAIGNLPGRLVQGTAGADKKMVFRKALVGKPVPADVD